MPGSQGARGELGELQEPWGCGEDLRLSPKSPGSDWERRGVSKGATGQIFPPQGLPGHTENGSHSMDAQQTIP